MKKLSILLVAILLQGCVGLAVGTYGTFEDEKSTAKISSTKNEFIYGYSAANLSKESLISAWGEPDSVSTEGKCEVLTYNDGYNWSGVGAFILFFPIPILVPTGHDENRFYFINGELVRLVSEYGEVTGALGYMCGSNECKGMAGPVNTKKSRKVKVNWCG